VGGRVIVLAALLCVAFGPAAIAADMPVKAIPAAAVYNWTGIYAGGSVGYGWAKKDWTDPLGPPFDAGSHNATGWLGGFQLGGNYQFGSFVVGVEGQYSWAKLKGSHISLVDLADTLTTQVDCTANVAARIGYAFDRTLIYGRGGVAWIRDAHRKIDLGAIEGMADTTRTGWLLGAGIEYAFWGNWSARLEYNYMSFGTQRLNFIDPAGGPPAPFDIKQNLQTVMLGLNYRF
jgi:outer membrane immunogenic protein